MLRLAFRFPAGRYHATPWGRHVNEGAVEWPPSPWRLLRALLATGFTKLQWEDVPAEARQLTEALAPVVPRFLLPAAATGHTRHYMPLYKDKTTKVLDTFAWVGFDEDAVLGVEWDATVPATALPLLDELLASMSYLGRAESWVEAARVDTLPEGLTLCEASDIPPGPGYVQAPRLAAAEPAAYLRWRAERLPEERALALRRRQEAALAKGKKPPATLSARQVKEVDDAFPPTFSDALMAVTADLQKAGWSQPPGSRWLSYWVREDALRPAIAATPSRRRRAPGHDTALLAVASDTRHGGALPMLVDALPRAEILHRTLVGLSAKAGGDGALPSPAFSGCDPDGAPLSGHVHASLLPLCLRAGDDQVARIDHFLVHAPMGFDPHAVSALQRVRELYRRAREPRLFLSLVGLGRREDFEGAVPLVRPAAVWHSATPFVPPRHFKKGGANSLAGQVQAELESRGLPAAERIELEVLRGGAVELVDASAFYDLWRRRTPTVSMEAGTDRGGEPPPAALAARWRHFRRVRREDERRPPNPLGVGLRLTFAAPVRGPIALGYASHFGLGTFEPVDRPWRP